MPHLRHAAKTELEKVYKRIVGNRKVQPTLMGPKNGPVQKIPDRLDPLDRLVANIVIRHVAYLPCSRAAGVGFGSSLPDLTHVQLQPGGCATGSMPALQPDRIVQLFRWRLYEAWQRCTESCVVKRSTAPLPASTGAACRQTLRHAVRPGPPPVSRQPGTRPAIV